MTERCERLFKELQGLIGESTSTHSPLDVSLSKYVKKSKSAVWPRISREIWRTLGGNSMGDIVNALL